MINASLFSSKKCDYSTPQYLFDLLNDEFHFDIDVCANSHNAKCPIYYTELDDGLSRSWDFNSFWCNPPYGKQISKWIEKAYFTNLRYRNTVVLLIPARTDTEYFHKFIYNRAEIRFIKGRLKFNGLSTSAPFPSMIVIYRGV